MELFVKIAVCLFAGLGAGFGTGLAGLSAAVVITPLLVTFLHVNAYEAVGIALASDVLASAVSAATYAKNKHVDLKNGLVMLVSVLLFTFLGSYLGSLIHHETLGGFAMVMPLISGAKFIISPVNAEKKRRKHCGKAKAALQSMLCGAPIGLICGFVGAGGGMMMLLILVGVLGYDLKTAVGTSVFIMTFTALTGAVSHFAIGSFPDPGILLMCAVFTLAGAVFSSAFANKTTPERMNRTLGVGLTLLSATLLVLGA